MPLVMPSPGDKIAPIGGKSGSQAEHLEKELQQFLEALAFDLGLGKIA